MDRIDRIRSKLENWAEIPSAITLGIVEALVIEVPKGLAKKWRSFVPSLMGLDIYREISHEVDEMDTMDRQKGKKPSRWNLYHRACGTGIALATEAITYGGLLGAAIERAQTDPKQAALYAFFAIGLRPVIYNHEAERPREKRLSSQSTRISNEGLNATVA